MPKNVPIVLSETNMSHVPLAQGETLSPDSIPISSENNNNIMVKTDGLFVPPYTGLTAVSHDYSLGGDGTAGDPLTVRISNLPDNIVQVRQQADNSGGLYASNLSYLTRVHHGDGLTGDGTPDNELSVLISPQSDNALRLIDESTSSENGLYVPANATLKRSAVSGNFSFNYPDDTAAAAACGKYGNGVYWKTLVTLNGANTGDANVLAQAYLRRIPCHSDKTPVPYQIFVSYRTVSSSEKPSVIIWFICTEVPTHLLDTTTGTVTQLTRGVGGISGGLGDLYPTGDTAVEPEYIIQYLYSSES